MLLAKLAAVLLIALPSADSGPSSFDYYLGELVTCKLPPESPMLKLIVERLAESAFETSDEATFYHQLRLLKSTAHENPDKIESFIKLDRRLQAIFKERLQKAKTKRLIYTGVGAVAGAVLGVPAGKWLGSNIGSKILWITVPAGALAGAGAGFLLGNILAMPDYAYDSYMETGDLDQINEEIEKMGR